MKIRYPDLLTVYTASENITFAEKDNPHHDGVSPVELYWNDVHVALSQGDTLHISLTAQESEVTYLRLRFNFTEEEKRADIRILGDDYERGYGKFRWEGIIPERVMPWYMLVSNGNDRYPDTTGRHTDAYGVMVRPAAICTWQYDGAGVTLWCDVRNGGAGVQLGGRTLSVCDVVMEEYENVTAYEAGQSFCRRMCPDPLVPDHKVYGSNNWYYAYGKSSHAEILGDTEFVADLCKGNANIPYMVIDDGWQKNRCDGPWDRGNERFPDMAGLAAQMAERGVRPGIWVRYLADLAREVPGVTDDMRLMRNPDVLDPSHPKTIAYVRECTRRIVDWGYTLIKHDYSTYDIFGNWGANFGVKMARDGWHFYDRSRTSAEIVVDLYRAIREEAGKDCVIIGCNCISHLCAGLHELNRTGDDTSGFDWERTRRMGTNTLAFRMIQNGTFYGADADCVGITGKIDWQLNRQWLDVLSRSGSPLFVSCKPGVLNDAQMDDLRAAFRVNSVQTNKTRPIDWMESENPELWEIDGETVRYHWYDVMGTGDMKAFSTL